jgi:hypothetical protein
MSLDLTSLLSPHDVQSFLLDVLGRHALHIEGPPAKFRETVSWEVLSCLLSYGGLGYPRLQLISGDKEIAAAEYSRTGAGGYPQLLVAELTDLLRNGATLAIDAAELLHEPISELCHAFERALEVRVKADLYASWNDGSPRDLQWDDHETFLCQVSGRKEWSLFQPTAYYPVGTVEHPKPTAAPQWQGTILPGHVLYIPRGWWYCDKGLQEPALYLALTFSNPRGIDIVWHVLRRAAQQHLLRMDVPRFARSEIQAIYLTRLQAELNELCTQPGLVLESLRRLKESNEARSEFQLPWTVTANPLPPCDDYVLIPLLRVLGEDTLVHPERDGAFQILLNGRALRIKREEVDILRQVWGPPPLTLRGLLEKCGEKPPMSRTLQHLSGMIRAGLVTARKPRQSAPAE